MAKFNTYVATIDYELGGAGMVKEIRALSRESAWHKAVIEAFDAIEPNTGDSPVCIELFRRPEANEHHG